MTNLDRATALVLVGAAVFFTSSILGAPPVLLVLYGMGVWLWRLWPRWGAGASVAFVLVGWALSSLVALMLSPLFPWAFQYTVAVLNLGVVALAVVTPRPAVTADPNPLPLAPTLWSLAGAVAWIGSLAIARFVPGSSAMSWAVLDDSTLDIWVTRFYAWNNGINTFSRPNPRPLEHAMTTSLLPVGAPLDASGREMQLDIAAHATHWTLTIALGCSLAGVLAARIASRVSTTRPWLVSVAAAAASTVILAGPATGFFVLRGQINASLTIALIFASILIAAESRRHPAIAVSFLILSMTLSMLLWTPFAAVPGALAVACAWRWRRELRQGGEPAGLWIVGSMGVFAFAVVLFAGRQFIGLADRDADSRESAVTVPTILPAPFTWWFTIPVLLACVVGAALLWRHARSVAAPIALTVIGILFGAVPLFLARGGFSGELEYYPSRYVQMATVAMLPVVVGVIVAGVAARRRAVVAAATLAAMGLTLVACSASVRPEIDKWIPAPVALVAGNSYGPDEALYTRIVAYADADDLTLPWNLDVPWDTRVRYALSVDEDDERYIWNTQKRSALRNRLDDALDRICEINSATDAPVTVVTADPGLAASVSPKCGDVAGMHLVTFVVTENYEGRETAS